MGRLSLTMLHLPYSKVMGTRCQNPQAEVSYFIIQNFIFILGGGVGASRPPYMMLDHDIARVLIGLGFGSWQPSWGEKTSAKPGTRYCTASCCHATINYGINLPGSRIFGPAHACCFPNSYPYKVPRFVNNGTSAKKIFVAKMKLKFSLITFPFSKFQ